MSGLQLIICGRVRSLVLNDAQPVTEDRDRAGAAMTGSQIYEWNGISAVGHAGYGVYRKPGATVVYVNDEMKNMLTMTDGKVTGFAASGKGHYALATGTAESLAGF